MDYAFHILILIGIYAILSMSLNLVLGHVGILSIAHATFYGFGAYVSALLSLQFHAPFLVGCTVAALLSAALGAAVALPALRIRDDYLVIATFALQVIFFSLLNNLTQITRGPMGLAGIPSPQLFGIVLSSPPQFLILMIVVVILTMLICRRIVESPFGRVLRAIREDEVLAMSYGKSVAAHKVLIFAISAVMASIAGVLYAHYTSYIDPTSFTVMESIFIISIVIIGGAGSLWGPVLGAVVLISLPELLRFIGLPSPVAANVRQILYGGLLVVFMMWRPQGFLGKYAFQGRETQK